MAEIILPRRLWHEDADARKTVRQSELLHLTGPIVILGEAGMGKTSLLEWLGDKPDHAYCTASQLRNIRPNARALMGTARTLVIDALDELSVHADGDAVDVVLQKLGDAGYPPFILSCRVADWRTATGVGAIREQYPGKSISVFHLEPFTEDEMHQLLALHLDGDAEKAREVVAHFRENDLEDMLGNPQTLDLAAKVATAGDMPTSKAGLYRRAVDILRTEHKGSKADLQPDEETALAAAGAAFASLILTGSEAIVMEAGQPAAGEIPLREILAMPAAASLQPVLGTRLFKGAANRLSYLHRTIGEYLGARWLAAQADTALKQERLLAMFKSRGLVPSSLRGMHAWLAQHRSELAPHVIVADPMGLIEYGDPDRLPLDQARLLLSELTKLAVRNPRFREWRRYSLKSLAQPGMLADVRAAITDKNLELGLRMMLLESLKDAPIASELRPELRSLLLDKKEIFAVRSRAVDALAKSPVEDWAAMVDELRRHRHKSSDRIGLEIVEEVGVATLSDTVIVDLLIAQAGKEDRVVGIFHGLDRSITDDRLEGILDQLGARAATLGTRHERIGNNELTDLAYRLIERRLALPTASLDPLRLWAWLTPFDEQIGYQRESRARVHDLIKGDERLRRTVQREVLLDAENDKNLHQRSWRLTSRSRGFAPTSEDVAWLLGLLAGKPFDHRTWRGLLNLSYHSATEGSEARDAAKALVANRLDLMAWVDRLSVERIPRWQIREDRRKRKHASRRAIENSGIRSHYRPNIEAVKAGTFSYILGPAKGYLNLFYDLEEGLPPLDRLVAWLGQDIADAARIGFECFLHLGDPPTARQMGRSQAKGRGWKAPSIVVAALAERVRTGRGFDGVSDDRLTVALYEINYTGVDTHAKLPDLRAAIEAEVKLRGLEETAVRGWIEPQLAVRRTHVDQLHRLVRDDDKEELASRLCAEWLESNLFLPVEVETEMLDRLIRSSKRDELRALLGLRDRRRIGIARRRNWDVVAFLCDFEAHQSRLATVARATPKWLWTLRDRLAHRRDRIYSIPLSTEQLSWLFALFRPLYRNVEHRGGSEGDTNAWDASDFMGGIAARLADIADEEAMAALTALRDAPADGYTVMLKYLAAEQNRKFAESHYQPPTFAALKAVTTSQPPQTVGDMQATLLALLKPVQARIKADAADPWRGFFTDTLAPKNEDFCRNHLITMLTNRPEGIDLKPEGHLADDNRADIMCLRDGMMLPIEIKGQWHADLWHAADTQLDRLYATDYSADRRGIYLVFWFGHNVGPSKLPKASGRGRRRPRSPEELRLGLIAASPAARDGRVAVVVLDLERPKPLV